MWSKAQITATYCHQVQKNFKVGDQNLQYLILGKIAEIEFLHRINGLF